MEEFLSTLSVHKKKLRILWFHESNSNAEIMMEQMYEAIQSWSDVATFEFINAYFETQHTEDHSISNVVLDNKFESEQIDTSILNWESNGIVYSWTYKDRNFDDINYNLLALEYVIDYMNCNGPYDGILAYNSSTHLVRLLLKLNQFYSRLPQLTQIPDFGILISEPDNSNIYNEVFILYPPDVFKLKLEYSQPLLILNNELHQNQGTKCKNTQVFSINHEIDEKLIIPQLICENHITILHEFLEQCLYSQYGLKVRKSINPKTSSQFEIENDLESDSVTQNQTSSFQSNEIKKDGIKIKVKISKI